MNTKTLQFTLVLWATSLASTQAQTFSENAVGFVTKTIPPSGFALIANPFIVADSSINALFRPVPPGTAVFRFVGGSFITATFDDLDNAYLPTSAAAQQILPGEGVFVRNPTVTPLLITFVGEVPQGDLKNPIPQGLSIRSSQVPQEGTAEELGFPGKAGDAIFQWNPATQSYSTHTFDDLDNAWLPRLKKLEVGEAFFVSKRQAGSWDRKFSVNQ